MFCKSPKSLCLLRFRKGTNVLLPNLINRRPMNTWKARYNHSEIAKWEEERKSMLKKSLQSLFLVSWRQRFAFINAVTWVFWANKQSRKEKLLFPKSAEQDAKSAHLNLKAELFCTFQSPHSHHYLSQMTQIQDLSFSYANQLAFYLF